MGIDDIFHLEGRDVFAPSSNDISFSVSKEEVTVFIHPSPIPCVQPAVPNHLACQLGVLVITRRHSRVLDEDLPNRPSRNLLILFIDDLYFIHKPEAWNLFR